MEAVIAPIINMASTLAPEITSCIKPDPMIVLIDSLPFLYVIFVVKINSPIQYPTNSNNTTNASGFPAAASVAAAIFINVPMIPQSKLSPKAATGPINPVFKPVIAISGILDGSFALCSSIAMVVPRIRPPAVTLQLYNNR